MEKIRRNGWKVVFLVVIALMCSHVIFGDAPNWNPPGPPAPTMTSLDAIYNAINTASCGVAEREGYCQYFAAPGNATHSLFPVPSGKRFVLLKLSVVCTDDWLLKADDDVLLHGSIRVTSYGTTSYMWDFPDRCVVVDAGQELSLVNPDSQTADVTIIGYFYDVP